MSEMKHLHVVRSYLPNATIGYMDLPDKRLQSLELPWKDNKQDESCVMEGTYLAKRDKEGRHQFYSIQNVINRTNVEWHIANYLKDLLGCTGFGLTRMSDGISIGSSRLAMQDILDYISDEDFLVTYRSFDPKFDSFI